MSVKIISFLEELMKKFQFTGRGKIANSAVFVLVLAALIAVGCENVVDIAQDSGAYSTQAVYSKGQGVGATINIGSAADFQAFVTAAASDPSTNAVVTADIDLTGITWTPIGKPPARAYTGIFDGGGYQIEIDITGTSSFVGIFGVNNGTIRNFYVIGDITVTSQDKAAIDYVGVVAYNDINGTVSRVITGANIYTTTPDTVYNVGGITGFNGWDQYNSDSPHYEDSYQPGGTIYQCSNYGFITGGFNKIGGIAGENAGTISESYNLGQITCSKTATGWPGVGGIAGRNGNNNTATEIATILNCFNLGNIIDRTSSANDGYGGITGWCNNLSSVINCYDVGDFTPRSGGKDPIIGRTDSPFGGISNNNYSLDSVYAADPNNVALAGVRETDTYMKSQNFVNDLNRGSTPGAFKPDYSPQSNKGYPILTWM
jgi:hypothetical protein